MASLVEAVMLRRAEEQMTTERLAPAPRREVREERSIEVRLCTVPGCHLEIVGRSPYARTCRECQAKGLIPSPCPRCGGPRRRMDQKHAGRGERSGLCQACRLSMPQPNPGAWKPGQSGNPAGRAT